jgi:hypothetical protein
MKSTGKIILAGIIFTFTSIAGFSQVSLPSDSLLVTGNDKNVKVQEKEQVRKRTGEHRSGIAGQNSGQQSVKRIRSGRPDMSRAGARPPMISRPGGSGVPKGMGKPGGAGRHGGR